MVLKLTRLLGKGSKRKCWAHPDDFNLCVKTTYGDTDGRCQNEQEYSYYKTLDRKGILNKSIPKIFGWVHTDKGLGLLVERVVNKDLSVSLDLIQSIEKGLVSAIEAEKLVEVFFAPFLENGIVVHDECPSNFLVKFEEEGPALCVIDGFGHRRVGLKSRLRDKSKFFANRKTLETKAHLLSEIKAMVS